MSERADPRAVAAAIAAAAESGRTVAAIPLSELATRLGISRATLQRWVGSREALHAGVRAAGVDPAERPSLRERAVQAAAGIIRRDGLGALTLERVAAEAGCSLPALHSQLGGRAGVLAAMFEWFSPLAPVERLLASPPATFHEGVRDIYGLLFDAATREPQLLAALLADALARPSGPTATLLRDTFLPRVLDSVGGWLAGEVAAGRCRPLPLPLLLQLLAPPMATHAVTRRFFQEIPGAALPDREATIDHFTDAFCRAVALPAAGTEGGPPAPPAEERHG